MKAVALAAVLFTCLSGAAFAGQCQDDLAKIDKALATEELSPDERALAEDMRNQAADLCKAGNEQESLDVSAEAKAMLNAE